VIYTQVKCVHVAVSADVAPELLVAAQVEAREAPCDTFRLGDPPRIEERCTTPVVRGPCTPPFNCKVLAADGSASYPRKLSKTALLGAIEHVIIRNGGSSCARKGVLAAVPIGGFGAGFRGRFEVTGKSGVISEVIVEKPGTGYRFPPKIVIEEGGEGCVGVELESVLSTDLFHEVRVFVGVGMDLQVIARDVSWDSVSSILASSYSVTAAEATIDRQGYSEQRTGLPAAMAHAVFHPPVASYGGSVISRRLRWRPMRSMGGAHPMLVCFEAQDSSGITSGEGNELVPHKAARGCIAVALERCRYAVRPGESMQHIAAYYSTNWIQLWALNTDIVNPDGTLMEGSIVNTGHVYTVEDGDVIDWVVRKFGGSRASIVEFNRDVAQASPDAIAAGQHLCIIPNSCATHI